MPAQLIRHLLWVLALGLVACDEDPGRPIRLAQDAAARPDRGGVDGGDDEDATIAQDAGPSADLGADAGDAGADAEPDQGPTAPPGPPDFDEVAAVRLAGGPTWLVWRDQAVVRAATLGADGDIQPLDADGEAPFDTPLAVPTRVEAHLAGQVPYAVISAGAEAIRVRPLDAPGAPAVTLDLFGEARASAVADGAQWALMVVGVDALGQTAAQVVREGEDGSTLAAPVLLPGLPTPDEVAPVPTGVVLRYATPGQCVGLGADAGGAVNFPCRLGFGRVLGTPVGHPLQLFAQPSGLVERYVVGALFGAGVGFPVLQRFPGEPPSMAPAAGHVAVVGEVFSGEQVGRLQLALVSPDGLWLSDDTWAEWPYDDARLVIPQSGAEATLLRFDADGAPSTTALAITERPFEVPFNVDRDPACVPGPEICDGEDQDCNGLADNGRCCASEQQLSVRTIPLGAVEVEQVLAAGIGIEPGWRLALKLRDAEGNALGWYGFTALQGDNWRVGIRPIPRFGHPEDTDAARRIEPDDAFGAEGPAEGLQLVAVGTYTALIGRDAAGHLGVWWFHPDADPRDGLPRPPQDLDLDDPVGVQAGRGRGPCGDYQDAEGVPGGDGVADAPPEGAPPTWPALAALPVDHYNRSASLLLVCPRRLVRLYPFDREPVYTPFPQTSPVTWATLGRRASDFVLHTAFLSSVGSWLTDGYRYDPLTGGLEAIVLPETVRSGPQTFAEVGQPFWSGYTDTLPYVQVRGDDVRVLPHPDRGGPWQTLRVPNLERVSFEPSRGVLVAESGCGATSCLDEGALYVLDLTDGDGLDLWPNAPTIDLWPVSEVRWQTVDSSAPLAIFRRVNGGLEVETQRVRCQR